MKVKNIKTRLVKLPADVEFTLFLIREELKSNLLLNRLSKAGFDDSHYRPDFAAMILESIGFTNHSDELFEFYVTLLDAHCNKVDDHEKIMHQSVNLYIDLVIEKRKRHAG